MTTPTLFPWFMEAQFVDPDDVLVPTLFPWFVGPQVVREVLLICYPPIVTSIEVDGIVVDTGGLVEVVQC